MPSSISITPTLGIMQGSLVLATTYPIVGMMQGGLTVRQTTFPIVGMMYGELTVSGQIVPRSGVMYGSLLVCQPFWSETTLSPTTWTEVSVPTQYICADGDVVD